MTLKAVLLDTSFFLRFLNDKDPLFKNADAYFRYFIQQDFQMMISTISIAEYCVGGDIHSFLKTMSNAKFYFIDIRVPNSEAFGILDLL